jgi:hypothetical protein
MGNEKWYVPREGESMSINLLSPMGARLELICLRWSATDDGAILMAFCRRRCDGSFHWYDAGALMDLKTHDYFDFKSYGLRVRDFEECTCPYSAACDNGWRNRMF